MKTLMRIPGNHGPGLQHRSIADAAASDPGSPTTTVGELSATPRISHG
jgi:hypothetical protein